MDGEFTCSAFLEVLLAVNWEVAEVVTLLMERPFDSPGEEAVSLESPMEEPGLVVVSPLVSSETRLVLPMENPLDSPCTLPCTLLSSWLNFTLTKFAILMTWVTLRCRCCQ